MTNFGQSLNVLKILLILKLDQVLVILKYKKCYYLVKFRGQIVEKLQEFFFVVQLDGWDEDVAEED